MYLDPRTTYPMAVLAESRQGPLSLYYFDVDPAELKGLDSDTRFQGLHLACTARELAWKPSVLFRYATFSGNKLGTTTLEAFNAPLSSGLDERVQGVNFKKVVTKSNLNSYRLRFSAGSDTGLSFTLDACHLWADVPLHTSQKTYGDELDMYVRWSIRKQLFLLGAPRPGSAPGLRLDQIARRGNAGLTEQVALFWRF